jgi:hypothetical protein
MRAAVLLSALTIYDWLAVTALRLPAVGDRHGSCLGPLVSNPRSSRSAVGEALVTTGGCGGHDGLGWNSGVAIGCWKTRAVAKLPSAAADAPNLVIIVVDTLRADHLSSHDTRVSPAQI